ncbi:angiopoietin-1 [Zeugodacus cucurbitae]|uniref:angiopoietin-1 n=1 Tax=Zeugodacus cucurbitae TaxID=28588 RepID=UPI0010A74B43|nr:angiopoietin-1 [Zeugodacus cucurbitae]
MSSYIQRLRFVYAILIFYGYIFGCKTQTVREINNTTNVTVEEIRTNDGQTIQITTTMEETHIEDTIGETILSNEFKNTFKNNSGSNRTSSTGSAIKGLTRTRTDSDSNSNIQVIKQEKSQKTLEQVKASCVSNTDSIETFKLPGWPPFDVRCIGDAKGKCPWAVILERKSPTDNFDFGWPQYRNGFGDLNAGNGYFVGLQNLYALTQYQKQELYISKRFEKEDLVKEEYANFQIGDESVYYAVLSLSVLNNSTMIRHLQVASKFTTKDRHVDERLAVCPRNLGMGWWYSDKCLQSTKLRSVWAYVKAPTIMAVRPNKCQNGKFVNNLMR